MRSALVGFRLASFLVSSHRAGISAGRQQDGEGGAAASFADRADPAIQLADHVQAGRQTQASVAGAFGGNKRSPNLVYHLGRDALAVIHDIQAHVALFFGRGNRDHHMRGSRLQRVAEQITQGTRKLRGIGQHHWRIRSHIESQLRGRYAHMVGCCLHHILQHRRARFLLARRPQQVLLHIHDQAGALVNQIQIFAD